jgi:hypothetical protein
MCNDAGLEHFTTCASRTFHAPDSVVDSLARPVHFLVVYGPSLSRHYQEVNKRSYSVTVAF